MRSIHAGNYVRRRTRFGIRAQSCRAPATPLELADHHVHLLSPSLLSDWKSLGVPFSKPDEHYLRLSALSELVAGSGGYRLGAAIVVPMAHLYGNDDFRTALGLDEAEERRRVAGENDWCIEEARTFAGSAVAFASVDFRRPYAEEELRRAAGAGAAGLKIHLASARADLRDRAVRVAIARLVDVAAELDLPLLVHLDPQLRGHTVDHVELFLRECLGPHTDLDATIAHLGGSGGFGPWTRSVLDTLATWLEAEAAAGHPRPNVRVDLSAAILEAESEGVPATTAKDASRLADALRRLGLARVVLASDHPVFTTVRTLELLRERSGLTASEVEQVVRNRAPVLTGE